MLNEQEKLDRLFASSKASEKFKENFSRTRFGRKLLAFEPDYSLKEIDGKDAEHTVIKVHGIATTDIKDIVKAAANTKESPEQVVGFLKALFPTLHKQAKIEENMGLELNEELDL